MLSIDLTGKRAFVAGVADDNGYGWAIAKALAQAGATVCAGTWPPVWVLFTKSVERGKYEQSAAFPGGKLTFERTYPLDAIYDAPADVPANVREDKRYREVSGYTVQQCAERVRADFGEKPLDIVVHSLANGPEVRKPLIETSRQGYLAALGASAYSLVSLVQHFAPLLRPGGAFLSLSYLAGERVIPGYGGGMSSAKAALESDTRVLAFEAGRKYGLRINVISAGPLASRAARGTFTIEKMIEYYRKNSAMGDVATAADVAHAAAFLCSPLAAGITGTTVYVDKGYHVMGMTPGQVLGTSTSGRQ
jgi:enoyl-[acyl-carrier protein] reductase I